MIPISKRQCARFYIYKNQQKCEMFIYINNDLDTLQKASKFALRFYSQKSWHFTLRDFSWNLWNYCLYIYREHDTLRSKTFLYAKSLTLCVMRFFMERLKLAEVGGGGFINKKMHFALKFNMQKTMHFSLRFYIKKSKHFSSHFYLQRMINFTLHFFMSNSL